MGRTNILGGQSQTASVRICEHVNSSFFHDNAGVKNMILDNVIPPKVVSLCSCTTLSVTFINETGKDIDLRWIDFEGGQVSYGIIKKKGTMDMNTYITHPWLFVDEKTNRILDFHWTDGTKQNIIIKH